jgi:integrase/AraC-like DNA-binding protein
MSSKLATVGTDSTELNAKGANPSDSVRKLAIEAVERMLTGEPVRVAKESKLVFKNVAKEAGISSTVLHREFGDVMGYVESRKRSGKAPRSTIHAIDARKKCFEAIRRIVGKEPLVISKSAKLNVKNVGREADVNDSYIYRALPDVLEEIAKQQSENEVYGNKETNAKLMAALRRLVEKNKKVTVKDVCREAKMREQFDMVVRKSYPDVHNAILDVITRQKEEKRLEERTAILEALERLRTGKPLNTTPIPAGRYLSVKKLMHESGVHETTILRYHRDIADDCISQKRIDTDDVWFLNDGELEVKGGTDASKLNFSQIPFEWLKKSAMGFIKASYATKSTGTLVSYIHAIKIFGNALQELNESCTPTDIDRSLIEKMLFVWSKAGLKNTSFKKRLGSLRQYVEWCEDTGVITFGSTRLIRESDYPKEEKKIPKFIPEYVMSQLNANIDGLHPHVMRFFLTLQEVGMRISECCALPFDCIYSDAQGDYFIKYYQFKMKKDHVVPISKELVEVIKEQQREVIAEFGSATDLLFPTPKFQQNKRAYPRAGKAWSKGTLIKNLNALANERNIVSEDGSIYHFSFHKFRHTTATRMINNGVPQHIVQRYLGHESPTMTSTYAHILDKTLKQEFAKFQGKMVDINGDIYGVEEVANSLSEGSGADSLDAQWLKKNIAVQTLPNGLCSLPVVQGSCPHANACLTCPSFRTDHRYLPQHKDQLRRTEEVIATCASKGWARQLEMNEKIKQSLVNIIEPLEVKQNDA